MHTNAPPQLGHAAISVRDPNRVAAFYGDLPDLQIVRHGGNALTGQTVLLSGDPAREDHELVLLTNPHAEHIAFRVNALEELRTLYRRAKQQEQSIPHALDTSVALSFFLRDPENNAAEVYLRRSEPGRDKPPLTYPEEIDRLILGT